MRAYNRNRSRAVLFGGIIFFGFAIWAYTKNMPEDSQSEMRQTVYLSIACSIVASGVFYFMQSAIDADINENVSTELSDIHRKLEQIDDLYKNGVLSIRSKKYYDKNGNFWKNMIRETSDQLDLVGLDISPWFSSEYRNVFIDKVKSMIKNKKNIRIILSGDAPDMENVLKVEEGSKDEKELSKIEATCYELKQIMNELKSNKVKKGIGNLDVYIGDLEQVPYMYIRTDSRCFISPYLSTGDSFLLEMEVGFECANWMNLDFEEMLKNVKRINLEKKNERIRKKVRRKFLFRK